MGRLHIVLEACLLIGAEGIPLERPPTARDYIGGYELCSARSPPLALTLVVSWERRSWDSWDFFRGRQMSEAQPDG